MAKSINRVTLKGRIGKDPQTSATTTGKTKCSFSVATDESWKDASGEWKSITDWHNVAVWGKLAEETATCLKKGALVIIEGKIKTRSWEKDGQKHYITEVVADSVDLIRAWPKAETQAGNEQPQDLPF